MQLLTAVENFCTWILTTRYVQRKSERLAHCVEYTHWLVARSKGALVVRVCEEMIVRHDAGNALNGNLIVIERLPIGDEAMPILGEQPGRAVKQDIAETVDPVKERVGERVHGKEPSDQTQEGVEDKTIDNKTNVQEDKTVDDKAIPVSGKEFGKMTKRMAENVRVGAAGEAWNMSREARRRGAAKDAKAVPVATFSSTTKAFDGMTANSHSATSATPPAAPADYNPLSPPPSDKALRLTVVHVKKGKKTEKPLLLPASERTVGGLLAAARKKFAIPPKKKIQAQSAQGRSLVDSDFAGGMKDGSKVLVLLV
jgi:hypothetical protein